MDRVDSDRTRERPPSQDDSDVNLLWMKLAVAVAVIRSKPPGITGKTHAENLRAQYFLAQARLQERLNNAKHNPNPSSAMPVACNSSQMTPPPSSDQGKRFQEQAMVRRLFANPESFLGLDKTSVESMRFTSSLMALQNLCEQNYRGDVNPYQAALSHLRVLRHVIEKDQVCLSEGCLCQAARIITALMARFPSLEGTESQQLGEEASFMQEICSFVEHIVDMLTNQPTDSGQYPVHRQKHSLVRMLLVFIQHGSLPLALSIVEQLTEWLEAFCTALRHSQMTGKLVSPHQFGNSYFTIQSFELFLGLWQRECPAHPSLLHEIQTRLDGCLLGITDRFPLVAQAVWRLTSHIEAILQNR